MVRVAGWGELPPGQASSGGQSRSAARSGNATWFGSHCGYGIPLHPALPAPSAAHRIPPPGPRNRVH